MEPANMTHEGKGNDASGKCKDIQKEIIDLVKGYKSDVPKGYALLSKTTPFESLDDAIRFLLKLFDEEEKAILAEHKKKFVTDDYENQVRKFAEELIRRLENYHEELQSMESYKDLCGRRHVAYGYYHMINSKDYQKPESKQIISDSSYEEVLYLGLAEFYEKFYGRFSDNEEAVELLCKFYPKSIDGKKYEEKIVSGLYNHVLNAGTFSDTGYAYHGIKLIETYIKNLPENIVYALLNRYSLYDIIYNDVRRHQVFVIINRADFQNAEKKLLKFWYLDSLIIGDMAVQCVLKKMRDDNIETDSHNNYYDYMVSDIEQIILDQPSVYWNNNFYEKQRILFVDNGSFRIYLQNDRIWVDKDIDGQYAEFPYYDNDWRMEGRYSLENTEKIYRLMDRTENNGNLSYGSMTFSLAYLDNYRGLHDQVIDFDHRFAYDSEKRSLKKNTDSADKSLHIYGKCVYSLTCIVGKNAAGKTSIIDFLREAFFKILKFVQEERLACVDGRICEDEYKDYNILDMGAKFLVVFSLGEDTYFVTNIRGMKWGTEVKPFHIRAYSMVNSLSKVAYFSSQLRGDQRELLLDDQESTVYDEEKRKKQDISKTNNNFRQADYSEKESFIRKRRALIRLAEDQQYKSTAVNREICYQLTFLRKTDSEKLREYMGATDQERFIDQKEFRLVSRLYSGDIPAFFLNQMGDPELIEKLEELIRFPDAVIEHFSAGQYAKFSFLAKLSWFLEGDEDEIRQYNSKIDELVFSNEEILLDGETALILIDEGEIYYHPEWQRKYIKTLLDIVNAAKKKVQIIVTTNSPFIISDILSEDITYLPDNGSNKIKRNRKEERTLGQNIHKLLKDNFFMEYTIGEYAREIIEDIMLCLEKDSDNRINNLERMKNLYFEEMKNDYDAFALLIEQIGEPVYRNSLKKMLDLSPFVKQENGIEKQIRELEDEQRKLQEKIDKLKERQ